MGITSPGKFFFLSCFRRTGFLRSVAFFVDGHAFGAAAKKNRKNSDRDGKKNGGYADEPGFLGYFASVRRHGKTGLVSVACGGGVESILAGLSLALSKGSAIIILKKIR